MAALLAHDHPHRKPEPGPDPERIMSVPLEKLVARTVMITSRKPNMEFHPSSDAHRKTRRTDAPAYVWLKIMLRRSVVSECRNPGALDEIASCFNFTLLANAGDDSIVAWRPRNRDADRTIDAFLTFAPGPTEVEEIICNVLETIFTKTESEPRRVIALTVGYSLMVSSGSPSPRSDRIVHSGVIKHSWADLIDGEIECDVYKSRLGEVRDKCLDAAMREMNRMVLWYYDITCSEEDGEPRYYLVNGEEQLMIKELSSIPFWGRAIMTSYLRPPLPDAEPPKKTARERRDSVE